MTAPTADRARRHPPALVVALATLAVALVALPLAGLLARADWGTLVDDLTSPEAQEALRLSLLSSLAAAGLFVPLVLGVWWKRTTATGAIWGMIAGFSVTLFYLVMTRYAPETFEAWFGTRLWFGIRNISSGLFGLPVAFIVTYVVSLMTAPPSKEMQAFIDSVRVPKGDVAWGQKAHE